MQNVQPVPAPQAKSRWRAFSERTVPLRYPLFVLLIVVGVSLGQFVEDALDTTTLEMLTPMLSIPRWTLVLLTLYMLAMLWLVQRTAARSIRQMRVVVQADDKVFEPIRARMTRVHIRTDIVLAILALGFVIVLFPILNVSLPVTRNPLTNERTFLPQTPLNAFMVLLSYTLVGWAALSLIVNTTRLGKALGDLTQLPLAVNVFDSDNVVPLGRLALVLSLAPAGVVLILLVGLGTPDRPLAWFAVLLATLASILALVLPLRGVHRQMDHAKKGALGEINHELSDIHRETIGANEPDATRAGQLSNRTNTLVNLRKVVQEGPTWPFQDTVAVTRALLVASAPLIYTVLNELIRVFLVEPLTK